MKVNAMNLAREIAAKHMTELSRRIDEIRKKYKPNYPANVDQLVDVVQTAHNHIVAQCREEIANAGVCDYLSTEDISMTINNVMREALHGKSKEKI